MARNQGHARNSRREPPRRKGGSLFMGLMAGLAIGLVIAAAVAVYVYVTPSTFKATDAPPPKATAKAATPPAKAPAPAPTVESKPKEQAPDYTFYHILQGGTPAKQAEALPREVYWLQVAALSNPKEADRLKARLTLMGLDVAVQQHDNAGKPLHRVRVGPFKTEDAALSTLDTLVANQFEPRLVKEAGAKP